MNIVAIIPARGGSKGVPKKNIRELGNYPLITYSIAVCKLSTWIDKIIVSTDSSKIAKIAKSFGADVPFIRPSEFAQDHSIDIEFFQHYLHYLSNNSLKIPDLIVHMRPTTPLREVKIVDDAIEYMIENGKSTALRSMHKTHLTPYKMFKMIDEYATPFLKYKDVKEFYNLPRQTFEDAYIPNGYVDIVKPSILLNTGLLHGNKIKLWETEEVADIDTLEDYNHAAKLLNEKKFRPIMCWLEEIK